MIDDKRRYNETVFRLESRGYVVLDDSTVFEVT